MWPMCNGPFAYGNAEVTRYLFGSLIKMISKLSVNKFVHVSEKREDVARDLWAQDSFEMNAIIPSFLKKGDTISIVATARWISPDDLAFATRQLEEWGFHVKAGNHLHSRNFQLAGTMEQRIEDMQQALDDPEVKAILIARGGYGTVHIIDNLDFSTFLKEPKWICGYSDITVLHAHLNSMDVATIHSTMPISFPNATPEALENLRLALTGQLHEIEFNSSIHFSGLPDVVRLFGGNLSVIYSLLGSQSLKPKGPIVLFLEDVDEMYYHVDRMMMALKRSGLLDQTQAVILGGLTQMRDNTLAFGFPVENPWGSDAKTTVTTICNTMGIPVIDGFPAGHQNDNRAFYLGVKSSLEQHNSSMILRFSQT